MKIYIFGCSWSTGTSVRPDANGLPPIETDFYSWVNVLAERYPEHNFISYAVPSSDLAYSVERLNYVRDKKDYDRLVFQITAPHRYSYHTPDTVLDDYLEDYTPNYRRYSWELSQKLFLFNPFDAENITQSVYRSKYEQENDKKFFREYISRNTDAKEISTHKALSYYAQQHTDLCFSHQEYDFLKLQSIENLLGKKRFNEFIIDNGLHFGKEGSVWQANWVAHRLGL
jgi:hypothetical protein